MHVLQIASGDFFSDYGGGQVYVRNLVDEMANREKVQVSVLSFVNNNGLHKSIYNGCALFETANLTDDMFAALLRQIKPDIVHAHSHKAQVCRMGKALRIPVVVTAHHGGILCPAGTLLNSNDHICRLPSDYRNCLRCVLRNTKTGLWWYPLMSLLPESLYVTLGRIFDHLPFIYFLTPIGTAALHIKEKQDQWQTIVSDSSQIIAPSDAIKEAMIRNGLPSNRCIVIPHGIPLPTSVSPLPSFKDGIRFFYVGRISYVKGIHVMLAAFHKLSDSRLQLHIIGGSGNKVEHCYEKTLRHQYKNDARIIWHGKLPPSEVYGIIRNFHVAIAPSIFLEVFGLNIAEALAMGRPVIATRCGGAEMQVVNGVNGMLIPPNDVESLAVALESVSSCPDTISAMHVSNAVIPVSDHIDQLLTLYSSLITYE